MSSIELTLESASKALEQAVLDIGGEQAALDACDRMYSATFRTEPYPLKDLEDWEELVTELYIDIALPIYLKETGTKMPTKPDNNADKYEFDSYHGSLDLLSDWAEEHLKKYHPLIEITGDTQVVTLCNYKGEGEGEGLYLIHKNLSVFISKNDSFYQVNGMI
jgi:hypothetical protein